MESSSKESDMKINLPDFSNNAIYKEDYLIKLIEISFKYYDYYIDKENYEGEISEFMSEFKDKDIRVQNMKNHLKFFIDFIDKYSSSDVKFINQSLSSIGLNQELITFYIKCLTNYNSNIELMKNSFLGKMTSGKVLDFKHNFKVKYIDSLSFKINFIITLSFKYINDEDEINEFNIDLTLNQFYNFYEQFQKIDTLIKTLI